LTENSHEREDTWGTGRVKKALKQLGPDGVIDKVLEKREIYTCQGSPEEASETKSTEQKGRKHDSGCGKPQIYKQSI